MKHSIKILAEIGAGAFLALVAPIAFAQTTTPAVPDTGVGGSALAFGVLAFSGVIGVAATLYLARRASAG